MLWTFWYILTYLIKYDHFQSLNWHFNQILTKKWSNLIENWTNLIRNWSNLIEKRLICFDMMWFCWQILNQSEINVWIWMAWNLNCQWFNLEALIAQAYICCIVLLNCFLFFSCRDSKPFRFGLECTLLSWRQTHSPQTDAASSILLPGPGPAPEPEHRRTAQRGSLDWSLDFFH